MAAMRNDVVRLSLMVGLAASSPGVTYAQSSLPMSAIPAMLQPLAGRWSDGNCAKRWNDWAISGLNITFHDQSGGTDVEKVVGGSGSGFTTQNIVASAGATGGFWKYDLTQQGTIRVHNVSTGTKFSLHRCAEPGSSSVQAIDRDQAGSASVRTWAGTWKAPNATIKITVLGNQLSAIGSATWGNGASTRTGDFSEVATPVGNQVSFGTRQTCFVEARLQAQSLIVEDNGSCGGLNVSFNGSYQRSLRGSTQAGVNSIRPPVETPSLPAAVPAPVPTVTNISTNVVLTLKSEAADLRGMISLFKEMIAEQQKLARPDDATDVAQQAVSVLTQRMTELQGKFRETTTQLSTYTTSVRPNDPDLQITARRASEMFPKIPYYIPGTTDTGEFWIEPVVSNVGELLFNLKFIDPNSKDRVREAVELSSAQLELVRDAMQKIVGWSKTAHANSIRRDFSRRAVCFPQQGCPEEGAKLDRSASTEIIFRVYEDGSTAGRFQRNKGRFESGYNISIESSLLLQAYLNHVLLEGKKEFDAGSRDASQLRELFK